MLNVAHIVPNRVLLPWYDYVLLVIMLGKVTKPLAMYVEYF